MTPFCIVSVESGMSCAYNLLTFRLSWMEILQCAEFPRRKSASTGDCENVRISFAEHEDVRKTGELDKLCRLRPDAEQVNGPYSDNEALGVHFASHTLEGTCEDRSPAHQTSQHFTYDKRGMDVDVSWRMLQTVPGSGRMRRPKKLFHSSVGISPISLPPIVEEPDSSPSCNAPVGHSDASSPAEEGEIE